MTVKNYNRLPKSLKKRYIACHHRKGSKVGLVFYYRRKKGLKKALTEFEKLMRGESLGKKRASSYTMKILRQFFPTCQKCGKIGKNEGHHILPLENGGETKLSNIIFLCPNCHQQAHLDLDQKLKLQPNIMVA